MTTRIRAVVATALLSAVLAGCTGGTESNAAEEQQPKKNPIAPEAKQQAVASSADAIKDIKELSRAIPVYAGAQFRDDLTRRDQVMVRGQFGPQAQVYTLATDDSYPQVYHYYTTYLAQFRSYAAPDPYPPEQQNWRTLEVQLNQAMQDPFIPGDTIQANGRQITLQIAETEAEPSTVIRYIISPAPPAQAAPVQSAAK